MAEFKKSRKKHLFLPDTAVHGIVTEDGEQIYVDAVFPVLHGKNGEDGTVQGLFAACADSFVGCDATSSGVCMDKGITNAVLDAVGIKQAGWISFSEYEYRKNPEAYINSAIERLSLPDFC